MVYRQLVVSSTALEMIIACFGCVGGSSRGFSDHSSPSDSTEKINLHRYAFIMEMFFEMTITKVVFILCWDQKSIHKYLPYTFSGKQG